MLFSRYLKFFSKRGVRVVRGQEPMRATYSYRWDGPVGACMRPLPSLSLRCLPNFFLAVMLTHLSAADIRADEADEEESRHENPCRRRVGESQAARDR